jgi:hypothetical protein
VLPFARPEARIVPTRIQYRNAQDVEDTAAFGGLTPGAEAPGDYGIERRIRFCRAGYCWLTVTVVPATVSVPVRGAPVPFASIAPCTTPSPLPEAPLVTVIQGTLLTAVQAHPVEAVTLIDPLPPAAGAFAEVGVTVNVQPDSWLMVTVRPATVTLPDLAGPVFAATEISVAPGPVPLPPAVTVIQGDGFPAVQAHSAAVVTSMRAAPPPAGEGTVSGLTV